MPGKPAARMGDPTAHGGAIAFGYPTVLIGGQPAARLGDPHLCPMADPKPHVGGVITLGSSSVLIGNANAARLGDLCGCNTAGISGQGVPPVVGPDVQAGAEGEWGGIRFEGKGPYAEGDGPLDMEAGAAKAKLDIHLGEKENPLIKWNYEGNVLHAKSTASGHLDETGGAFETTRLVSAADGRGAVTMDAGMIFPPATWPLLLLRKTGYNVEIHGVAKAKVGKGGPIEGHAEIKDGRLNIGGELPIPGLSGLGISIGEMRDEEEDVEEPGGVQGTGTGGLPNAIVLGHPTVLIGG